VRKPKKNGEGFGVLLLISMLVDPVPKNIPSLALVDRTFSAFWWGTLLLTIGTVMRGHEIVAEDASFAVEAVCPAFSSHACSTTWVRFPSLVTSSNPLITNRVGGRSKSLEKVDQRPGGSAAYLAGHWLSLSEMPG